MRKTAHNEQIRVYLSCKSEKRRTDSEFFVAARFLFTVALLLLENTFAGKSLARI
jgi:hypothetical protein